MKHNTSFWQNVNRDLCNIYFYIFFDGIELMIKTTRIKRERKFIFFALLVSYNFINYCLFKNGYIDDVDAKL